MAWTFNPFTGNFDQKGSGGGGGGSSYIDGEVATFTDLPLDGSAALNTAWLVREASGTWLIARKPAGIYIRTATGGTDRNADWTYAGILPDVFNDANFLLYDNDDSTKNLAFQLSGITSGQTRTLTVPDASGTLGFLQSVTSITVSSTHQLTAARNQRVLINNTASAGTAAAIFYPSTGNAEGDRLEVVHATQSSGSQPINVRTGQFDFAGSRSISVGEQGTFIYTSGAWTAGSVETHTHAGLGPTFASSAFQVTEAAAGNSTNRLAFSLSGITAGTTRTLTVPNRSGTMVVSDTSAGSGSDVVNNIVSLTQAEYNAIGSPDAATLFLITDP